MSRIKKSVILSCIHVCYVFMGIILIYADVEHCLNLLQVEFPMQYPIGMVHRVALFFKSVA